MRLPELNEIPEWSDQDLQVHASETCTAIGELTLLLSHIIEEIDKRHVNLPLNVMEYWRQL